MPDFLLQVTKSSAARKQSKWGRRLRRTWVRSRSKQWQNLQVLDASHRPVPGAKRSKIEDQGQGEQGQQLQGQEDKGQKQSQRMRWRGRDYRSAGSRSGRGSHPRNPVLQEWLPVEGSEWQDVQVRTVGESLQPCFLNRQWWVTEVRRSSVTEQLQLRLTDQFLATSYASPSDVVKVADDAQCTAAGPVSLDYRALKLPQRVSLAKKLGDALGRDVELPVREQLLEQTTLAWSLQEIHLRLPCAGVLFMSPAEVDAVCAMAVAPDVSPEEGARMAVYEAENISVFRARVNAPSVNRVVHSDLPSHYTLLDRRRSADGHYQLRYFDSLRQCSANGRRKAQVFVDVSGWQLPVPEPANMRFQSDGWSCGLWCLQFAEEAVREERGEPKVVPVVAVTQLLTRVSAFHRQIAQGARRTSPRRAPRGTSSQ
jgi:hypothetical protein